MSNKIEHRVHIPKTVGIDGTVKKVSGVFGFYCDRCKEVTYTSGSLSYNIIPTDFSKVEVIEQKIHLNCFHCGNHIVSNNYLDPNIAETVGILQRKGYSVLRSCEGSSVTIKEKNPYIGLQIGVYTEDISIDIRVYGHDNEKVLKDAIKSLSAYWKVDLETHTLIKKNVKNLPCNMTTAYISAIYHEYSQDERLSELEAWAASLPSISK